MTEPVREEQIIVTSAEIEQSFEEKIQKPEEVALDVGCGWRKRGNIGVDYLGQAYGHEFVLDGFSGLLVTPDKTTELASAIRELTGDVKHFTV